MKKFLSGYSSFLLIPVLSLFVIFGCEIDPLSAPNWFVNANLPFLNKIYSIMDLLEDEENIGVDSNTNVFFNAQSSTSNTFQKDIRANGVSATFITVPTQLPDSNVQTPFDDSTFVTRLVFEPNNPQPVLNLRFFPSTSQTPYSITLTITNLINNSSSVPYSVTKNISNNTESESVNLIDFSIINSSASNLLTFNIKTTSSAFEAATFSYDIPQFLIRSVTGKIKPVNLGVRDTVIDKPFGDNSLEGEVNFGSVNTARTYLVIKRSKSTYQVDLKNITMSGESKSGRLIKFAYLRYDTVGAPPQPIDSTFNLRLPSGVDSVVYYVNTSNSNVLNFVNNVPKKINLSRTTVINQNYNFGDVDNSDDIKIYFSVELPLHFSIVEPTTYIDTVFRAVTDSTQRARIPYTRKVDITFNTWNHLPILASVRAWVLDTNYNLLFSLTDVVSNNSGDSVVVPAAPVDFNGFVSLEFYKQFTGTLDSANYMKLLNMRKIIFEYKLYTDPNQIPTVDGRVRIRSTDYIKAISFGMFEYKIH